MIFELVWLDKMRSEDRKKEEGSKDAVQVKKQSDYVRTITGQAYSICAAEQQRNNSTTAC